MGRSPVPTHLDRIHDRSAPMSWAQLRGFGPCRLRPLDAAHLVSDAAEQRARSLSGIGPFDLSHEGRLRSHSTARKVADHQERPRWAGGLARHGGFTRRPAAMASQLRSRRLGSGSGFGGFDPDSRRGLGRIGRIAHDSIVPRPSRHGPPDSRTQRRARRSGERGSGSCRCGGSRFGVLAGRSEPPVRGRPGCRRVSRISDGLPTVATG